MLGEGHRRIQPARLERDADDGSLEAEDRVLQRTVVSSPIGDVEDHVRDVGNGARVASEYVTRLLEHFRAMELDEGILEIAEPGHEERGLVGPAEPSIDFQRPDIFSRSLGAPGRRFEVAGELPEIAGLGPAVQILEQGGGEGPALGAAREIDGCRGPAGGNQEIDRLLDPPGGRQNLNQLLLHVQVRKHRNEVIGLCLDESGQTVDFEIGNRSRVAGLLKLVVEALEMPDPDFCRSVGVARVIGRACGLDQICRL